MKRTSIVLLSVFCASCGSFQLAAGVTPPYGKTGQEMQLDILVCKDQAKNAANTAPQQAGAFLLGYTIVGLPVAYEMEKSTQRQTFASCMTGKGYQVRPVDDDAKRQ